jgi:hypothetical protein
MTTKSVTVTLHLPAADAWPLAEICKRFSFDDAVRFASRFDNGLERDAMLTAVTHLQRALAEAGFAPR